MNRSCRGPWRASSRVLVLVLLAGLHGQSAPAQETDRPAQADSARADSLRADSLAAAVADTLVGPLEGELAGSLQDSVRDERYALLDPPPELPPAGSSAGVIELSRDRILQSNALSLLELLEEQPGLTVLRGTWFGGPHQVMSGALGPGFLTVLVDGREVTTMDGAQPDLTRFPIANLQRVRLVRGAAGWTVELTTLSRERPDAYSRIEGGTGDPGLSRLRLVFDNGIGGSARLAASADLVDAAGDHPSNDFNFVGLFEISRDDGDRGLAVSFQSESLEREVYSPATFRRTELFLRGQFRLAEPLQLQLFGGTTGWKQEGGEVVAEPDETSTDRSVLSAGATLRGDWDRAWARASIASWDSDVHPDIQLDGDFGGRLIGPLHLDAGGRMAFWEDFDAMEAHAGLALDLPLHLTLRGSGASGTRGIVYPTVGRVDSLSFNQVTGRLDFRIPEASLYGLVEFQDLENQLPFGAVFDRFQTATEGPIRVTSFEAGGDIPLIPLSWLFRDVSPIRLHGFWRYQDAGSPLETMYVPEMLYRGALAFEDEFFEGNLGVNLQLGLRHRASMGVPPPDAASEESSSLVGVPAYTSLDWNMAIRILSVIVYYRYDNLTGIGAYDFPDLEFPGTRSIFGVKWTFLN